MNKVLAFESGLQQDRKSLFNAPPPTGSVPNQQQQNDNKSKRDLLWEQKRQQRLQSNPLPQAPQKHVSFSPNLFDPSQLPPPPFKEQHNQNPSFANQSNFSINQMKPAIKVNSSVLSPRQADNAPSFTKFAQNDNQKADVPQQFQHAINQYSNIQNEPINQPTLGGSSLYTRQPPELVVFDQNNSRNENSSNQNKNQYRSEPPVSNSRTSGKQQCLKTNEQNYILAGPPSGKQDYLRQLQSQMEYKKMRQKEEKRKQIQEDRSQIKQMDRYAPWGASARQNYGAGAPLRDQVGNIVTARANAISNPYSNALNPKPTRNFTSVQSQPNLYPNSSYLQGATDNMYKPPLSPQLGQGAGYQQYVPGNLGGVNQSAPQNFAFHSKNSSQTSGLAAAGNGILQPSLYNQKQPQFMPPHQPYQPRPIDMIQQNSQFPESGQNLHYERKQYPLSAHGQKQQYPAYPPPQQQYKQIQNQFEQQARRSQTPLGMTAANNIGQSKYVTKVVDENAEKKKHAQRLQYQQDLKRQIQERERAKNQIERKKKEEERRQEERLERQRKQIEEEFKSEQEKKKKKKSEVNDFNLQNATGGNDAGHVVMSKNPKAAAKRREAQLFGQKSRDEEQQPSHRAKKREELFGGQQEQQSSVFGNVVQFSDHSQGPPPPAARQQRKQFSETRIIENVSKQIRKNMDKELQNLRNEINQKEENFQKQVGQLKVNISQIKSFNFKQKEAKHAEQEKFRSQQELDELKHKLEDNKLRDIKYEHELALALKKTDGSGHPGAGLRAEFLSKPTSQLLPIGEDPRPNIINPNIKGLLPEEGGGTFKTLRHESQLIPVGAGQNTLMGAGILQNNINSNIQKQAPVIGMQAQNRAPVIITHPKQIGDNKKSGELSLSLNGTAKNININSLNQNNPYDSFPSIPDVNGRQNYSRQVGKNTSVNQTLDGFTMNSINLNKVNKKNHDRLADLQQKDNINYKKSDPSDELAKLDDLLFSLLKPDDNSNTNNKNGTRPQSKQDAINFEQQVRGMIQDQSQNIGGGKGIQFNDREHSLRSFEVDNQIYRDQMNEIYNSNVDQNRNQVLASQKQYFPPTQKTLNKLPGENTFNIDSFVMADTHKFDSLKGITFKNQDSMQGLNSLSLNGGNAPKLLQQRQQTISSIRGGAGGYDLDSIDEAPQENSLKQTFEGMN